LNGQVSDTVPTRENLFYGMTTYWTFYIFCINKKEQLTNYS